MSLTKEQLDQSLAQISEKFKKDIDTTVKEIIAQGGYATHEQYKAIEDARKKEHEEVAETLKTLDVALKAQGKTLADILESNTRGSSKYKSLHEQLEVDKAKIATIKHNQTGFMEYMLTFDKETGKMLARPFGAAEKAVSIHSTIDIDSEEGLLASVVNSMSAASILRSGNGAQLIESFKNTNWLFDLVNYTTVGFGTSTFKYWEELPTEGSTAIVPENGIKPQIQYRWELKSVDYKKAAAYFKITDEFELDFPALTQRVYNEARRDVAQFMNNTVATDLLAQATPFVVPAAWASNVPFANEYDVIMAMASVVESNTFSNMANVAVMNTNKKWRISANKDQNGQYLMPPAILNNIRFVGNPAFGSDDIVVGDLKQYNLVNRGGMILKVGYVDDDLIHNRFTAVVEQFFFNYIPASRKGAIVKGQTFAAVKAAIEEPAPAPAPDDNP